ncbi:hypothetical protein [Roseibacillus ishigakijimensis]|uniref:Uncharacterized protein n=1 Tax=Roseibacillus ishigakijimensis TaxID=454146 RepID=A0A934RRC3_9BACT|nr:hypothetical protein [Roseibacillus ishigakijimensis]MBK1833121.1 hypothetical protein [Roseibacillus ishigakijimensis]
MSAQQKNGENHKEGEAPTNNGQALPEAAPHGDPQVAQIRQLIFGEQMVGYEDRFSKLEQKLNDEIDQMRAAVDKSLSELREAMQKRSDEVEAASVPRSQIAESLEQLARTLRG